MRRGMKTATAYIHTVLMLAMIAPVLYAMPLHAGEYDEEKLYALGMLVILPVAATGIAIQRCRSLLLYLCISIAAAGLTIGLGAALGKAALGGYMWGYVLILSAELLWVILERCLQRASMKRGAATGEGYCPGDQPRESLFDQPRLSVEALFVASYLVGILLANPALCDQAFWSGVLYLFAVVLHRYIDSTEEYLSLHKRVRNLPSKRIYGISNGILAVILTVLLALAVMAAAFGGYRPYTDLREIEDFGKLTYEPPSQPEWMEMNGMEVELSEQMEVWGEAKPAPLWLNALVWIAGAAGLAGLLFAVVQAVRAMFQRFRENYEENGDMVEELQEEAGKAEWLPERKRRPLFYSRQEQIRYQYRRFIRKHRKDKPGAYETPYEIETLAQVADSEEGQAMHRMYEEARYGKGGLSW